MAERVLVVDDHPPMVGLIQDALTREGFVVRTAHDGAACLRSVAAERPDLIILDVIMPGMDGFEVLRRLREQHETQDIPVIILTVRKDQGDLLTGYMAGANLYMNKPCEIRDLIAAVKRLLGTAARI
jgi:DNA-binding response OmpR family regulator